MASRLPKEDRHPRIPIHILIEYQHENRSVTMYCLNMSRGGLFVETNSPAPVGTKLKLKFTLPTERESFFIQAKVMWIREAAEGDLRVGMGLEFFDVDAKTGKLIDRAIAHTQSVLED